MTEHLCTPAEAAVVLGVSKRRLRQWQQAGRIVPCLHRDGVVLFTREELARFSAIPRGPGIRLTSP